MHDLNLVALAFDNPNQAFKLRDALIQLQGEALFDLAEAVVVTCDGTGKVQVHQSTGEIVRGCASAGSVAGLIMGAIFGIPWAGSALGAGVGAMFGAQSNLGVEESFIKDLGATLQPGTSALIVLGKKAQLGKLGEKLVPLLKRCTLLQTTVDPERESEIRKWLAIQ